MTKKIKNILRRLLIAMMILTLASSVMLNISYAESVSEERQMVQTVENIEDELVFLYIESKELEAPGTQNIALSWDENISRADELELVYADADGNQYIVKETERTDSSVLFTEQFSVDRAGIYTISGVNYIVGETTGFFAFDSVEIKAQFTVVDNLSEEPAAENIVSIEQDTARVDSQEIEEQVADTLAAANAPSAEATSAGETVVVVLDPGHGSGEAGSSGNGLNEHQLNFKIAQYCKTELETYDGVEVYLTHNGEGFTGTASERLQKRVNVAAAKNADVLVSLHVNATGFGTAQGAEVWYPNANYKPAANKVGKAVAQEIQDELVKLGLIDRGVKEKSMNEDTYPDGSLQDWYGIIRYAKLAGIPGIIVEHAYIDNKSDVENFLNSDAKLQKLGIADATGIAAYYGLTKHVEPEAPREAEPAAVDNALKEAGFSYAEYTAPDQQVAYIRGFEPGSDVALYIEKLQEVGGIENITYADASGTPVTSGAVATGQKITFEMGGKSYTRYVVLAGDANGDGEIYATDYVKIKNHIMNFGAPLEGAYKCAADTNGDALIYATDYVKTKNHIMGVRLIDQGLEFKVYDI